MTLTEIKRWSLSEPPAVQQMVNDMVEMVERLEAEVRQVKEVEFPRRVEKIAKDVRRQAFLDAADMVVNYLDPIRNIENEDFFDALTSRIAEALRKRAEEEK